MRVEDVYVQGPCTWVRLHEKGGKRHEMPCHHNLEANLHAYMEGARLGLDPTGSDRPMSQPDAYRLPMCHMTHRCVPPARAGSFRTSLFRDSPGTGLTGGCRSRREGEGHPGNWGTCQPRRRPRCPVLDNLLLRSIGCVT
jgi:hypothetical protein